MNLINNERTSLTRISTQTPLIPRLWAKIGISVFNIRVKSTKDVHKVKRILIFSQYIILFNTDTDTFSFLLRVLNEITIKVIRPFRLFSISTTSRLLINKSNSL